MGAVLVCIAAAYFSNLLPRSIVTPAASFVLFAIMTARGSTRMTSSFLRSQGKYVTSQLVEGPMIPGIVLLMLVFGLARTEESVLLVTAAAGLFAGSIGILESLKHTSPGTTRL